MTTSYLAPGTSVLVTGATGAIGFEIARQAAACGATVGIHGSSAATVDAAIHRLHRQQPKARLIAAPADFQNDANIAPMIKAFVAEAGSLDAVVHCAITGAPGSAGIFAKTDPGSYGVMAALVLGTFEQLCFAAMPHLAGKGGTIIAFASDAGRFAAPRQAILGGIYGGIMAFVRNLAVEAAREKVRVHCISPSFVRDTPVYDRHSARGGKAAERAGLGLPSPRDIAPLALFLCGPDAAHMTGQVISINGGLNA